jgi:hypothetical protein
VRCGSLPDAADRLEMTWSVATAGSVRRLRPV